ncbi:MAG: peptidase C39 family protein, partial [Verrucomicrobiae bacterium]|nr:peptidase C39 family protein [Verrucomicrobiae bacterium]
MNRLSKHRRQFPGLPGPIPGLVGLALLVGTALLPAGENGSSHAGCAFRGWTRFDDWPREENLESRGWTSTSPVLAPGFDWDELVVSWNATTPRGSGLVVEAQPVLAGEAPPFYTLGRWALEPGEFKRESVPGQRDRWGEVNTDTLVLREPARGVRLRLRALAGEAGALPELRFLGASFLRREGSPQTLPPNRAAWGRTIDVPRRTQADYPEGINEWCSPTSLSMVLAWWGGKLGRDELIHDVRDVARGVHDPAWPGTGNWPFNTAYAGSFTDIRAYVTRLTEVAEIEAWIAAGIPVIASVDYDRLRARTDSRGSGHLIVVVGFTVEGDVVVNDPGSRARMRNTFSRADFVAAWKHSRQTVYLVHPESAPVPEPVLGHWFAGPVR